MKLLVCLGCLIIASCIATIKVPVLQYSKLQDVIEEKNTPIPILKHEYGRDKHGYHYSFQSANGIHSEEVGFIKNEGDKEHEGVVQKGRVTYIDEHGNPITLSYVADEHGFQPQGDHLPTPPAIPLEIKKALEESGHEETLSVQSEQFELDDVQSEQIKVQESDNKQYPQTASESRRHVYAVRSRH